jgi:hypothetical protein
VREDVEAARAVDAKAAVAERGQVDGSRLAAAEDDVDGAGHDPVLVDARGHRADGHVVEAVAVDVPQRGDRRPGGLADHAALVLQRHDRRPPVDPHAAAAEPVEVHRPAVPPAEDHERAAGVLAAERVGARHPDDDVVEPVAVEVAGRLPDGELVARHRAADPHVRGRRQPERRGLGRAGERGASGERGGERVSRARHRVLRRWRRWSGR